MTNHFLIREEPNSVKSAISMYFSDEMLDPNHLLYSPDNFAMGYFKNRKKGFVLSNGGIWYRESPEVLIKLKGMIDEGSMKVIEEVDIEPGKLEQLMNSAREYVFNSDFIRQRTEELLLK